jgi:hypothetical protein
LPPILPDARLDLLPPVLPDTRPDTVPDTIPLPDTLPPRPDTAPDCTAGVACTAACVSTCQVGGFVGFGACSCVAGTLTCTTCQVLPITISPEPCPDNASGKQCSSSGLSCIAFTNGLLSGACMCSGLAGGSLAWRCL